jgi:arylsulfatase A-like enzyme
MKELSRRGFLKGACASAGVTPLLGLLRCASQRRRNVLFIAIDDLNDWVGCLGRHPNARTPNLDRLARTGTLFTNAHCPAPACNPSRAALLTGVRPSTSGVYLNSQPFRSSPALEDAITLPQHFAQHGYKVIGGGKIFHEAFPDPVSWEEYWPSMQTTKPEDPDPPGRPLNGIPWTQHFDWGPLDARDEDMGDWQVADWAIGKLQEQHDRPFFLGCGFFRPHLPWYVPQKYFDLHPLEGVALPEIKEDDLDDVPAAGRRMVGKFDHDNVIAHKQWRKAVQAYLASITFVDTCVGRVLASLEESPYRSNTAIVLWSDHGWHLGEKLHWRKFALWEHATRNPLIIVVPGLTSPGSRCDAAVSLLDLYPTLIDLYGLTNRKGIEGTSLVPLLQDPGREWKRPALITYGRQNHSLRSRRWRYTRYADGSEELYDHETDDLEWINLASDTRHVAIKEELQRWLPKLDARGVPSVLPRHLRHRPLPRPVPPQQDLHE